jgi:hypothetical protein
MGGHPLIVNAKWLPIRLEAIIDLKGKTLGFELKTFISSPGYPAKRGCRLSNV